MPVPINGAEALRILRRGIKTPDGKIIQLVDPLSLEIDPAYQRPLVPSQVDRIRREFDSAALGVFQVGQRKETKTKYCYDGQNRLAGIKARAADGEPVPVEVLALVEPNTTQAEEAHRFVQMNTNKPVTGNAKFKARLVSPDSEPEHRIKNWANDEGFVLDFLSAGRPSDANVSPNGIYSVANLLSTYQTCPNCLKPALRLLRLVWGRGNSHRVPVSIRSGQVIQAIAMFLRGQGGRNIDTIATRFITMDVDLAMIWSDIKRREGYGYDRPKTLAEKLTSFATGR